MLTGNANFSLPNWQARIYTFQPHLPGRKLLERLAQLAEQLTLNHRNLEANWPTLPKTLRIQSAELISVANAVLKQLRPDRKRAPVAVSPLISALRDQ